MKKGINLNSAKTKAILERLFRKGSNPYKKLLNLETKDFYAFIINNVKRIKVDFLEVTSSMPLQLAIPTMNPKTATFHIPEQDFFRYDPSVKDEIDYLSNAYRDYTSGYNTTKVRSRPEHLFEKYCENDDNVEWVYKNGDAGQQYFSIVYFDGLLKQWLFYPDYIVKNKDGSVWVIETKGGEHSGHSDNIDIQIANKFNAFKNYAEKYNLKWGFVRNIDDDLFINNTKFAIEMSDDNWRPLKEDF